FRDSQAAPTCSARRPGKRRGHRHRPSSSGDASRSKRVLATSGSPRRPPGSRLRLSPLTLSNFVIPTGGTAFLAVLKRRNRFSTSYSRKTIPREPLDFFTWVLGFLHPATPERLSPE